MGGSFLGGPLFKGVLGGSPPLFRLLFLPKVEKLANLKSQKGFKTIGSSKPGAIGLFAEYAN